MRLSALSSMILRGLLLALVFLAPAAHAVHNAQVQSHSAPSVLYAGQVYGMNTTMRNNGTDQWYGPQGYRLRAINPDGNTTWGASDLVIMPGSSYIDPGQSYSFSYNITAPLTVGVYNLQLQMYQPATGLFGAATTNQAVTVGPAPPTNVVATKGTASTVTVTWTASITPGVTYNLWRCSTDNDSSCAGGWTIVSTGQTGTSYVDTPPVGAMHYIYQPQAEKSGYTTKVGFDVGWSQVVMSAITDLTATQGTVTDRVNLSWGAKAGAWSYKVYFYSGGSWVNIGSVTAPTTSYSFDIASYGGAKSNGTYGTYPFNVTMVANTTEGPQNGSPPNGWANGAPTAATLTIAANSKTGGSGSPSSVTDPNSAQGEAYTYTVTSQPANGTVSVVGSTFTWTPPNPRTFSGATTFGYRITDKGGATFDATGTVNVTAVDDAAFLSQTVPTTVFAGQSFAVVVNYQNTGATTWTTVGGAAWSSGSGFGLASQNPAGNTTWGVARLQQVSSSVAPLSNNSYSFNVTAPAAGGTYNFQVQTVHDGTYFGDVSPNVVITVVGPPATPPSSVAATDGTMTGKVRVTWSLASGADSYKVWRKSASTSYTEIGTTSAATFDDTVGLPAETGVYTYAVQACNPSGCNAGMPSDTGYPNIAPTSASVTMTATSTTPSAATLPTVVDPNVTNGNSENFTFSGVVENTAEGTVTINAGQFTYTPPASPLFTGTHTFTFTATDKAGATVTGTGTVTVSPVDGANITAFTAPTALNTNQAATATVTVTNTGTTTWGAGYTVGTAYTGTTSTVGTFSAAAGSVAAGASTVISLPFTAPATPGTYVISVKMRNAGGTWFGNKSVDVTIVVTGPPAAPATVTATQGTQTGQVTVSWTPTAAGTTDNYLVYRTTQADYAGGSPTWTQVGTVAYGTNTWLDSSATTVTQYAYTVAASNGAGASAKTNPAAMGYANVAPTSSSTNLTATSMSPSTGVLPTVVDPNATAGQSETFTATILSQPAAGQGTASVVGNKLVWTPPGDYSFAGTTTFTYTVVDRGGASVVGSATVVVSAWAPNPPTGVTATRGTITDTVRVSWIASSNAVGYNVYAGGLLVGTATGTTLDVLVATAPSQGYTVRAFSVSGGESADSSSAPGWPNLAPTASSATLTATAMTPSAGVTPSVTDPNSVAGQLENFTFAVTSQPAAGEGTASVVSNKLVWTPPAGYGFAGTTTFTYTVTDRGGATFVGTATVNVGQYVPPVPTGFTATQGTQLTSVRLAWTASTNTVSYNVYQNGTLIGNTTSTSYDYATSNVASRSYTVRSVSATGGESANSASASGWPDLAPTAASASLTATATTSSSAVTPSVTDPNVQAGQSETFTFTIATQPPAGQGTAAIVGNKLQWSPPVGNGFSGSTSFDFVTTDKGGGTVTATATVTVTPFVPTAPTALTATQGTITGTVRLAWTASAQAASYNVYQAGTLVGTSATTSYDYVTSTVTTKSYTVRSVSASGGESVNSNVANGWPNLAPTAATAASMVAANAVNAQVTITVTDPNATAGQAETFSYTPASGSTTLGGSFSFSAGKFVYSAPQPTVSGTDTASFTVTDKGGATFVGTATLTLCSPPTLGSGTATIDHLDAVVVAEACNGAVSAAGTVQYRPNAQSGWTNTATLTQANAAGGVNANYSVSRPANARAGEYEVRVTLTDASGQSSQGTFAFTVGCVAPVSTLASAGGGPDDVVFVAAGGYTSSDVCAAPITATLQAFAAADVTNSTPLSTGTLTSGTVSGGASGLLGWSFPGLPPGSYRAVQTVQNGDGTKHTAAVAFSVDCPAPTVYTVGISHESGLDAASGLVLLSTCNLPAQTQVVVTRAGAPTALPVTLFETVGGRTYYRFDYPVDAIGNGSYPLDITVTDGAARTTTKAVTLVIDRGTAAVQLTVGGTARGGTSGAAESLGQFGVKPGGAGLPAATRQ